MKVKKKIFIATAGAFGILALCWTLWSGSVAEVDTVLPERGSIVRVVEDTGVVQPSVGFDLFATQGGRVKEVPVSIGQQVKKGQVLVILENLDLELQRSDLLSRLSQARASAAGSRASLESARLGLNEARQDYARQQELFEAGAVTREELDRAGLRAATLEQVLKEQNSILEGAGAQEGNLLSALRQLTLKDQQLEVRSPVEGIVLSLPAALEQVLPYGARLVSVAAPGQLEIKADILSDDLGNVALGQRVKITAPVLGQSELSGVVEEIYPRAEEKQSALGVVQRRVPVIISVEDISTLKPGYEVQVSIETASHEDALLLPLEAVRTTGAGGREVLAVDNGRIQPRTISTGINNGEKIEITEGLEEGQAVLRDASTDLPADARVKIK